MYLIIVLARVALGAVFSIAGIAKLSDGFSTFRKSMTEFGVPRSLIPLATYSLPFAEIAIGLSLFIPGWGRAGSISALALLVVFSATIATNLALGRKPTCNCFGQLHSKPIGRTTLIRNAFLAVLAVWLVWQLPNHPNGNLINATMSLRAPEIVGAIAAIFGFAAIAVEGFFILHVLRQNGRLLLRVEALETVAKTGARAVVPGTPAQPQQGLPIGQKAFAFELPTLRGQPASLEGFLAQGRAALLLFTDPNCGPCNAVLPEVATWQRDYAKDLNIILISSGSQSANQAKADEFGVANILVEKKRQIAEKYQAFGTPSAVLVRNDGTVGSYVTSGADAIRRLIVHRAWDEAGYAAFLGTNTLPNPAVPPRSALQIGSPAPLFVLPDLEGKLVRTNDFAGHATVLLFWNPSCGFCKKMLFRLLDWERSKPANATRLLLVSTGSRELNLESGLSSAVVLDQNFAAGPLYGSRGTPSAILISASGEIGSDLAVGETSVMKLLASSEPDRNIDDVHAVLNRAELIAASS